MLFDKEIQPLYNHSGNLEGVFISASKWFENEAKLEEVLFSQSEKKTAKDPEPKAEPINDWNTFLSYWDFNYPVEKAVNCRNCGASTDDWTMDDPKKFRLKAANMAGMVSFLCLECQCRVTKKHFKDHICYECSPLSCAVI